MKMETAKMIIVGIAVLITMGIVMSAVFGLGGSGTANTGKTIASAPSGEVQEVRLTGNGVDYTMTPSTLKAGTKVRMTVDTNTVLGCMRTIVIPAFRVSKTVSSGNNVIEFTPDKAGTFSITCGMGMGRGSFKVDDGSGDIPELKPTDNPLPAGSCGSSAGGCGCGGA